MITANVTSHLATITVAIKERLGRSMTGREKRRGILPTVKARIAVSIKINYKLNHLSFANKTSDIL